MFNFGVIGYQWDNALFAGIPAGTTTVHNGTTWYAATTSPTGEPTSQNANWIAAYDPARTYQPGDLAGLPSSFAVCINTVTGIDPITGLNANRFWWVVSWSYLCGTLTPPPSEDRGTVEIGAARGTPYTPAADVVTSTPIWAFRCGTLTKTETVSQASRSFANGYVSYTWGMTGALWVSGGGPLYGVYWIPPTGGAAYGTTVSGPPVAGSLRDSIGVLAAPLMPSTIGSPAGYWFINKRTSFDATWGTSVDYDVYAYGVFIGVQRFVPREGEAPQLRSTLYYLDETTTWSYSIV